MKNCIHKQLLNCKHRNILEYEGNNKEYNFYRCIKCKKSIRLNLNVI
jgi:hypothetical protein